MARRRRTVIGLTLIVVFALTVLAAGPTGASAKPLTLRDAKQVALTKVKKMQRKLKAEGARSANVRGCWREGPQAVGCLGLVSGVDDFLRWRCALPMTIRKRPAATAAQRLAVKYTPPMCSF